MRNYKPMLAKDTKNPFSNSDWIFEVKWDGIRAIAHIGDKLSIKSRNDNELIDRFPELIELLELSERVVLDGEIIIMEDGKPSFQSVLKRSRISNPSEAIRLSKKNPSTYLIFDILEKEGKPLVNKPLVERKKILSDSVKEGKHVVITTHVEEKGEAYFRAVTSKSLEGIIAKRKNSKYVEGRSSNWLKIKKIRTCDCVIFGYTKGTGSREQTFGSLLLGLYNDEPLYVGKVGSGFTYLDLEKLKKTFKDYETTKKTLVNVKISGQVTWLQPRLVCEVGYHSVTKDGMLRMARFYRLRDKDPTSCKIDQLYSDDLRDYWLKRDFTKTPEPEGGYEKIQDNIFVIQEHHARRLHWDLRLERGGVLKSWAIPKGLPEKSGIRRLAIKTEDHPIEYAVFSGTIPKGEYGAGTVKIWDKGIYKPLKWEEEKIEFLIQGEKINGMYILVKLKKGKSNEWLLLKAVSSNDSA